MSRLVTHVSYGERSRTEQNFKVFATLRCGTEQERERNGAGTEQFYVDLDGMYGKTEENGGGTERGRSNFMLTSTGCMGKRRRTKAERSGNGAVSVEIRN